MADAEPQADGDAAAEMRHGLRNIAAHPVFRVALPIVIAAVAVFVLHTLATEVKWTDVRADITGVSGSALAMAIVFAAVSFAALALLDVFALAEIGETRVPRHIAALTGSSSIAIANLLGFSYLTAGGIRLRVYSSYGVDTHLVAGVFALSWVAFSAAVMLVLGGLLVLHPAGTGSLLAMRPGFEVVAGAVMLASMAAAFAYLVAGHRTWRLGRFSLTLPRARTTALMTLASATDLLVTSLILYVFLPADLGVSFPYVFVVFVAAIGLGISSHTPGGIGVFEATIIAGLNAGGRSDVLAALVLYRLVYTVLPFLVAVLGLAFAWVLARREDASRIVVVAHQIAEPIVPYLASAVAMLSGVVLLVSGTLPSDTDRISLLDGFIPLPIAEASHLTGSIAGVLLLIVARGLYRRLARAWTVTIGLLGYGFVTSLLRGLDAESALLLAVAAVVLVVFRDAFYRRTGASAFRLTGPWIVSLAALLATLIWIGFFVHSHVAYRDALWWQFAWHGDASRFLRASVAGAVVLAGVSLNSVLTRRGIVRAPEPIPEAVRAILATAEAADANIALSGDKSFLLSPDGRAFLAYADTGRSLISKGDPVGPADVAEPLIWELRRKADVTGRQCAFYGVSQAHLPTYLDMGLSILKIGEVARVRLEGFSVEGPERKDFRYAMRRAAREGFEFAVIPAAQMDAVFPALRKVSDAWLQMKQGEEKGFALGAFDETYLRNFDHAVIREVATGRIVAFANLWQGGNRYEASADLMRYHPDGPKYVMDALFGEILIWARDQGFQWFNLGAAPFAGMENRRYASLWTRVGGLIYEHGEQFYHFEGLRAFKQKFDPVWSPNYLASPGGLAAPRILYEVNVLVSGGVRGLVQGD
jgi:phosphatidylglycerol lysyltransferase